MSIWVRDEYVESDRNKAPGVAPFTVTTQTQFLLYTDLDDPGGTEVWCDYDYDGDDDILLYDELERAEKSTRRLAETVTGGRLLWDGRTREIR